MRLKGPRVMGRESPTLAPGTVPAPPRQPAPCVCRPMDLLARGIFRSPHPVKRKFMVSFHAGGGNSVVSERPDGGLTRWPANSSACRTQRWANATAREVSGSYPGLGSGQRARAPPGAARAGPEAGAEIDLPQELRGGRSAGQRRYYRRSSSRSDWMTFSYRDSRPRPRSCG